MTLDKIIEKQVKRFDEKFLETYTTNIGLPIWKIKAVLFPGEVADFLRQAIRQAVEKALGEVELGEANALPISKHLAKKLVDRWGKRYDLRQENMVLAGCVVWDEAVRQQLTKHKNLLSKKEK